MQSNHQQTCAYPIPEAQVTFTQEIKKSRFITTLAHVEGVEAARALIQQIRQQHPQARHHCWGYIAAAPNDSQSLGFSDDGEPSGTAGKPILAQLLGSGIGEICAVVTRYSGGIKLGTGGLVKAYGGGVKNALQQLQVTAKVLVSQLQLSCDYSLISTLEHCLANYKTEQLKADYGSSQVTLTVTVPQEHLASLQQSLVNQSKGRINIETE